jgi:hypothetical protein
VLSADLPPGAIAGGIPDGMRGTFTGGVLNWLPDYFNQSGRALPYPVRLTIADGTSATTATSVWDEVGKIEYVNPEGSQLVAPVLQMYAVECDGRVAGRNPTYECFQFVEDFLSPAASPIPTSGLWWSSSPYEFQAFTLSLQEDGSLYYAYHQGLLVSGIGYLHKEDAGISHVQYGAPSLEQPQTQTSVTAELCAAETVVACLEAFYAGGCVALLPTPLCSGLDFEADQNNPAVCVDFARCDLLPGVLPVVEGRLWYPDVDTIPERFGRYPPVDMRGTVQLKTPAPPHAYGLSALGDGFEVRQIPVAPFGCAVNQGVRDVIPDIPAAPLQFEITSCTRSEYGQGPNTLKQLVSLDTPVVCLDQIKGPRSNGECLQGSEVVLKDGLNRQVYSPEAFFDADRSEWLSSAFAFQTDGTIYWTVMLGSVVMADGTLEKAEDFVTLPSSGSTSDEGLAPVWIAVATIGACAAVGVAGVVLWQHRNASSHGVDRGLLQGGENEKAQAGTAPSLGQWRALGGSSEKIPLQAPLIGPSS